MNVIKECKEFKSHRVSVIVQIFVSDLFNTLENLFFANFDFLFQLGHNLINVVD
jgi:hypothetical protein